MNSDVRRHRPARRRPAAHLASVRRLRLGLRRRPGAHAYATGVSRPLVGAIAAFAVAAGSLALPALFGSAAAATYSLTAGTTTTYGCAGSALTLTRAGRADVTLSCAVTSAAKLGPSHSYVSASSSHATTAVPAGSVAGTLLVSTVETSASATVSFGAGWTKAYDRVNGTHTRLTTAWRVYAKGQAAPSATLSRKSPVSMLTVAVSGVNAQKPQVAAAAVAGLVSPAVTTAGRTGLVLLTQGSAGSALATAPSGSGWSRAVGNAATSEVGVAIPSGFITSSASRTWALAHTAASVSGALALRPVAPASVPAGATPVVPGTPFHGTCPGYEIDDSRVDATTVTLTCTPLPVAITTVGGTRTFTSTNSSTPSTGLPAGAEAGDVVVSFVETYAAVGVSFGSGWHKVFDTANGSGWNGARLVAYWKVLGSGDSAASATLSPGTQVSMATMAFSGVDGSRAVEASASAAGQTSPSVDAATVGDLVLFGQGSAAWQFSAKAPTGTALQQAVHNDANAQVAVAAEAAKTAGDTSPATWNAGNAATSSVAGTLALVPAAPGAIAQVDPSGSPTSSPTSPSTSPTSPTSSPTSPSTTTTTASSTTTSPSSTTTTAGSSPTTTTTPPPGTAPASPPALICGSSTLNGPSSAPSGAVTVTPSQNIATLTGSANAGTTFWLSPGTYHLGTGQYDQIQPKDGDTFIGAPGAIIDGQHDNLYAFVGQAKDVTVSFLTIQNFGAAGDNNNEGVVNHDAGTGWTMTHNTIQNDAGAGAFLGNDDTLSYNCLRNNGQYGFSSYLPDGVSNLTLDHNEISGNNTDNWEVREPGCGCTGGGKFWDTDGAVVTDNYVHDNRGVGLWADTNNTGFLFQGNYISGNDAEGLMYEISYNAAILDNTFVRNAIVAGPTNPGFPASAIYLSESGSDPRAGSTYGSSFQVAGNVFTDNWAGIVAWENADRFAGSPANSSTGITTLVNPSVATLANCGNSALIGKTPYINDCRWKTQNLAVHDNTFNFTASHIGSNCTVANTCGFNGLFSNYGTYPSWSPYQGSLVEDDITFHQNNVWSDNTYNGAWNFMIHDLGNTVPWSTWRSSTYGQDAGSTLNN